MNESDVIAIVRRYVEERFPSTCSSCGRRFGSLREYLLITRHVGNPVSYDAELGDWSPAQPLGTLSFATCPCGTTLAVSSDAMPPDQMAELLSWARDETARRGIDVPGLLGLIRAEIDRQVLAEPEPPCDAGV